MPASRTRLDLPKVVERFTDRTAGKRVDDVISKLLYELAVNYKPPVSDKAVSFESVSAFAADDATPSVAGGSAFKTANANATTITDLEGGTEGQQVWLLVDDANTTIDFNTGTNITGNGGANFVAKAGDCVHFIFLNGKWRGFISES